MKIQDLGFFAILLLLIWLKNFKLTAVFGLLSLFLALPLFTFWIFFTAERLTWFAASFFFLAIIQFLNSPKKHADFH